MTRYAKLERDSFLYKGFKANYEADSKWLDVHKEVSELLGIETSKEYFKSPKQLVITPEAFKALDQEKQKTFRPHPKANGYTPKMNLKVGKELAKSFAEIVSKYSVNVENIGVILFMSGFSQYSGMRHFHYADDFYLTWDHAHDVPEEQLEELTHEEFLKVQLEREQLKNAFEEATS
ncbi:hypothetical protein ADM98_11610 [Exiguobacterium sp. BMC-KP]|uniref:hypothetical protein n=1 Tax=Exiguobacterium sp. BMC-KP TaxID=1684312 RepID=UPI0006AA0FA6|nr:hypothetical protein [Exiguobacterium sp. BMC-KP]KOP29510.1 hypothetical protein ADM98_11610 [Exiguobacterium sp. BMC-KP]